MVAVKLAGFRLITTLVGLNRLVVAGVAQDRRIPLGVQDAFRSAAPFFAADEATIAVPISVPGIVLWLANLLKGRPSQPPAHPQCGLNWMFLVGRSR